MQRRLRSLAAFLFAAPLLSIASTELAAQPAQLGYTIVPSGQMTCQNAAGAQNRVGGQAIQRRTYLSEKGRAFLLFNPTNFAEGAVIPVNGSGRVTMPFHVSRGGATRTLQLSGTGSVRVRGGKVSVSYSVSRSQPWGDGSTVTVRMAGSESYEVDPASGRCTVQSAAFSKHLSAGGSVFDDFSCRSSGPVSCSIQKGAAQ